MNVPFFYAPDIAASTMNYVLDEASARHCVGVLRHRSGDHIILTDGRGKRFDCLIDQADKKFCSVRIQEVLESPKRSPRTGIGISFTKSNSRLEWFIEKSTEIGISDIYPLVCQRTERTHHNLKRLHYILVSAMLQSEQLFLPVLHESIPFAEFVQGNPYPQRFMAHCDETEKIFLGKQLIRNQDALVIIGPEGDFTPEEITMAREQGFQACSLGDTRLRTETAGIVACTLLRAVEHL